MTIEGRQQWLAQQQQKREGICQDAALLKKYSIGTALTDEEKKRVQRLKKNAQQRKRRRNDTVLLNKYYDEEVDLPVTEEEEKRVQQLDTARNTKHWKRYYRNTRAARDDEYYSWRKTFLHKRRQDFVASILKGEGGSTYDAVGDAAYCERLVELENEYDRNFSLSLSAIPVEEMEEVYNRIENDRYALRDATAALVPTPLLNEPAADEEEAVPFVAPVKVRALCSHEGCKNQFRAGGLCSSHGAQRRACSMEGCMSQARKEGVCVTHGAQTRRCDHEGCSKQVVRGGKCNSHGQSERPQMVSGRCSKCPIFSNTMQKVDGDLVCVCYPCMSHSGKGVRCIARGCNKHVRPVKGETRELQCVFHRFMAFKRCIHPGCFNDALQGGVCWCHGANTKLCCYDAKLFDESTQKWIVSHCTHYARKGGECTMHGVNIQEQTCSYNKWGQKCTNRARNGGVCYDHYFESLI
jgi:hypothetical protein